MTDQNKDIDFFSAASAETFKLLLEGAPDGIILSDSKGIMRFVNDQTGALLGYSNDELIGKSIDLLVPEASRKGHDRMRDSYSRDPKKRPMGLGLNLFGQHKNGQLIPVEISLSPITVRDERCVLAILRDVTELRKLSNQLKLNIEELRRSNSELEKFAYIASHDLQEPLRMISGYTQLLLKRYSDKLGKEGKQYIDFAVDGAKRMQSLINDLLTYSKLNSKRTPTPELDINSLMRQVLSNLSVAIEESKATLKIENLPAVTADPVQMIQLFQNLIGNALKFGKTGVPNEIAVSATGAKKQGWIFSIKDKGIGIKKESAEKVFEIFHRLNSSDSHPGTGVGLAICKKIVENHRGEIWLESEPGQGTTFFFTLNNKPT